METVKEVDEEVSDELSDDQESDPENKADLSQEAAPGKDAPKMPIKLVHTEGSMASPISMPSGSQVLDASFSQNSLVEIAEDCDLLKGSGKADDDTNDTGDEANKFDKMADHPLKSPFTKHLFCAQEIPDGKQPQCHYTPLEIYLPPMPGNCTVTLGRIFMYMHSNIKMNRIESSNILKFLKSKD